MVRFPGAPYIYVLCNINPTNIQRTDEQVFFLWGRGHFSGQAYAFNLYFSKEDNVWGDYGNLTKIT